MKSRVFITMAKKPLSELEIETKPPLNEKEKGILKDWMVTFGVRPDSLNATRLLRALNKHPSVSITFSLYKGYPVRKLWRYPKLKKLIKWSKWNGI